MKNALAELKELRQSGGKRADNYELKEEEDVYDEVDDEAYARIVQKRREEGGALFRGDEQAMALHPAFVITCRRACNVGWL